MYHCACIRHGQKDDNWLPAFDWQSLPPHTYSVISKVILILILEDIRQPLISLQAVGASIWPIHHSMGNVAANAAMKKNKKKKKGKAPTWWQE